MASKINWLIKGYPYSVHITNPTTADNNYIAPHIWINTPSAIAFILTNVTNGIASWVIRTPDYIISEGTDYQINVVEQIGSNTQSTGAPVDLGYLSGSNDGDLIVWNAVTNLWNVRPAGEFGIGLPSGINTGDFVRWNAIAGNWEVAVEPIHFKGFVLTPALASLIDAEGAMYYNSLNKAVMVCTESI